MVFSTYLMRYLFFNLKIITFTLLRKTMVSPFDVYLSINTFLRESQILMYLSVPFFFYYIWIALLMYLTHLVLSSSPFCENLLFV